MARHYRAQIYRNIARSFREEAAKATCPGVRIQMFYTARGYDQMAESIAEENLDVADPVDAANPSNFPIRP